MSMVKMAINLSVLPLIPDFAITFSKILYSCHIYGNSVKMPDIVHIFLDCSV